MGGCRCTYKNCDRATNNTKDTDFHFFHFPIWDKERVALWIENACRPEFKELPPEKLRNKVVCQLHFTPKCFTNEYQNRLIRSAVPSLDGERVENWDTDAETKDVTVIPADDQGTVFTLATQQYTRKDCVTYVYHNGDLVPSNQEKYNKSDVEISRNDLPKETALVKLEPTKISESISSVPILQKKLIDDVKPCIVQNISLIRKRQNFPQMPSLSSTENLPRILGADYKPWKLLELDTSDYPKLFDTSAAVPAPIRPCSASQPELAVATPRERIPLSTVQRCKHDEVEVVHPCSSTDNLDAIIAAVKQNTKDIASLKGTVNRVSRNAVQRRNLRRRKYILGYLQKVLPPTLLGAVSLHITKNTKNYTPAEMAFINLKECVSQVQQVFEKCGWNSSNC